MIAPAAALLAAFAAGCSSEPTTTSARVREPDPPPVVLAEQPPMEQPPLAPALLASDRVPTDLSVDVTVLVGRAVPEMLEVQDRPAKYILLPDGALHADSGRFIDISTRPGRSRWLYDEQVEYVWSALRQAGFSDPSNANGPPNPDMLVVGRGERMAIVTLRAHGRVWTFVRRAVGSEPMDPAVARIVRTLAAMAWIPDLRPADLVPERYDYGPDPYAVYREIRERERALMLR